MKFMLKLFLCISLLMSTALLTQAGDQHNGGRCSDCLGDDPPTAESSQTTGGQNDSTTTDEDESENSILLTLQDLMDLLFG